MAGGLRAGGSGVWLPGLLQDVDMPVLSKGAPFPALVLFLPSLDLPCLDGPVHGIRDARRWDSSAKAIS